jgi:site-specific DNA-methyltransferase (adenine-specific)
MGTGTTLLAAALEGGRGIGIELDPSYLAVAERRLETMQGELIAGAPP